MKRIHHVPGQLFLPGFEAPPQPTDRLFFAIVPAPDAAAAIVRQRGLLRDEFGVTGKPIGIARLHVTLSHLGDYLGLPQGAVKAAMTAADSIRAAPFDVAFDRAASFHGRPRKRPLVLLGGDGLAALAKFQETLGRALEKAGFGKANPHYTPHVTLLYDNRLVPAKVIETIGWTAHEFVLVHSLLGQTRHIQLARWALSS
ncbi:2'-5' RNA ligase family protein [Collimonas sp. OK412]|jgi:2'-5' RNA ligase|uniref:2'-5' RNA ligase family protein n=1 Tax=Collimonas sp. (strain OK412) TaxID=1801619 RepID=UPI0008E24A00|nr:2'-5' RNA ligase family protein [Collimonas sp. OK412]SFC85386.1 2'-5' RNA ligase [Collimonas sp. OK412]